MAEQPHEISDQKKTVNKQSTWRWFVGLTFLMALASIVVGLYTYLLQGEQQALIAKALDNTGSLYKTLQPLVEQSKQDAPVVLEPIKEKLLTLQQATEKNTIGLATLENKTSKLQHIHDQRPAIWVLREVEYLIRIADLNLRFVHHVPVVIDILETAIRRVQSIGDPHMLNLQQAMTEVITQLKILPTINLSDALSQLSSMKKIVEQFPFASTNLIATAQAELSSGTASSHQWQAVWEKSMKKLSKLLIVKKHEAGLQPVIYPEHKLLVQENLVLIFDQLSWSLIQGDAVLFQKALVQANQLLDRYADPNSPVTSAFKENLLKLSQINLDPKRPSLADLLEMIKQQIENRQTEKKNKESVAPAAETQGQS